MKHKIMGFGEIGQSIAELFPKCAVKEKNYERGECKCDFLHVCIPYSGDFRGEVCKEIKRSAPRCVIIHSSVKPGTTVFVQNKHPHIEVVHSPVIGVHPNLYDGLRTFPKWMGYDVKCKMAKKIFEDKGIEIYKIRGSSVTEKLKLLSTTYYGINIAMHQYAYELLGDGFPYFEVWNREYNKGYIKLGKPNVSRPILYPPKGKIGGHCVVPNAMILKMIQPHDILEAILNTK